MFFGQNPPKTRYFSSKWAFFLICFIIWHLFLTIWQMFPKIIIFALQQIKIFQNHPLSKIRIFWKNIHPWIQLVASSKVTLPWFYAHWILIGSLSRVLLAELFSSNSPGFYLFYHNVFDSSSIKLQGKDKDWQTRRDKYLEQKQRDSATGKMLIKSYSFS